MSSVVDDPLSDADAPAICEFCGGEITEPEQDCPALYIGRCQP